MASCGLHLAALVVPVLAGATTAQTVWSMGSPWTDLAAVVATAAPGDIVLLNGLQFPPLTINKGLTVLGPGTIGPSALPLVQFTTLNIPSGQQAHFVSVQFTAPGAVPGFLAHRVDATGSITFDGCLFDTGSPHNLVIAGTVRLHHCTVQSAPPFGGFAAVGGVLVNGGECSMSDCSLSGGPTAYAGFGGWVPASPAVYMSNGDLTISHSSLTGGRGAGPVFPGGPPAPALYGGGGRVRVMDSRLIGGAASGSPGVPGAVAIAGGVSTLHARCLLQGGAGSPPGMPTGGLVFPSPQMVGLGLDHGWQLGQVTTLKATAGTSQLLGLLAGSDGTSTTHPAVSGPIAGSLTQLVTLVLATPTAGSTVSHGLAVPNQPQLLGASLFAQAFQLDGVLVQASAAVGGAIH